MNAPVITGVITPCDLVVTYRKVGPRRWVSPGKEFMFALLPLGPTRVFPSEEAVLTAKRQGPSKTSGRKQKLTSYPSLWAFLPSFRPIF